MRTASVRILLGTSVLWLGLAMLADGMAAIVLPFRLQAVADPDSKATLLGLLTFAGITAGMLVQPVVGAVSDRQRDRLPVIGLGVALTLVSLWIFGVSSGLLFLALSYLLTQAAAAIAQAGQQGLMPELVVPDRRGTASGLKGMMDLSGALLGFVLLGSMLEAGDADRALAATGAVLLVTFLLTALLVRERPPRAPGAMTRPLSFMNDAQLGWLTASRFLFLLGTYAVGRFLLFFGSDRLGLDPGQGAKEAGMLLAGLTLLTVLASPAMGWAADRAGRRRVMLFGVVLSVAGALLLAAASSLWQMFLFGGLMSVGSAGFIAGNWALTADQAPPHQAGQYFGLANFGTAGASATAGLLGPLIDWGNGVSPGWGYLALFTAAAAAFAASGGVLRKLPDR